MHCLYKVYDLASLGSILHQNQMLVQYIISSNGRMHRAKFNAVIK